MNVESLLDHLENVVREEIGARVRIVDHVAAQEAAIRANRPNDLAAATSAIESEVTLDLERARRRERIFEALAAHWKVAPGALTLGSVAERCSARATRIHALRAELRARIADVVRANRRVARLVQVHRRLLHDTIGVLAGCGDDEGARFPGLILDARG